MIKSIKLKFGKSPNLEAAPIPLTPVTVFVGPNNSGKSKILSEINDFCNGGLQKAGDVILDNIEYESSSKEEAEQKIQQITLNPRPSDAIHQGNIIIGKRGNRLQISRQNLQHKIENPNSDTLSYCGWYLRLYTLILDGKNRISLTNMQPVGDLKESPPSSFRVLFDDEIKRAEVRRIIYEAFESYLVMDPTNFQHLRINLAARAPNTEMEEKGIHGEAVRFHSEADPIENSSDGVKAFAGIIIEIIAGDPYVLLIDEPEAFLHPALSFKLGKEIATTTKGSAKRIFISTHSAKFVMGCIQSGVPVNIVRLTYRGGVPTARILPNEEILRLMRNPLLRSTGVLEGLFYEFVVITEADTDRAFYQEINERLLTQGPDSGIPNCLFINAQNKQTVQTIVTPLRELGIPAVGIVDIDVLKDGGTVWTRFLTSGSIPKAEHESLAILRKEIKDKFDATNKDMKREGGIELLSGSDKEATKNLFEKLAEYGLFVVPNGELESWLPNLGVPGHGPEWLIAVFEIMGENPESPSYLKPSNEDVWKFLGDIRSWLMDTGRKGIPT